MNGIKVVRTAADAALPKKEKPATCVRFDTVNRTWEYTYTGWDGKKRSVEFQFEKSLKGLSMHLIEKNLRGVMKVGVNAISCDGVPENGLITTLILKIPNFWPYRDPHQILSEDERKELYHSLMMETQGDFLQRLANGWRNLMMKETHSNDFWVDFVAPSNKETK